jgi:uncharacterized protein YciI
MIATLLAVSAALGASNPAVAPEASRQEMPPARATYYVALYEAGPAWVQGQPPLAQPGIREHGEYMDELHRRGHLRLGGPLVGDLDRLELAGALLVIDAGSLEEARALVLADPALEADIMRLKSVSQLLVYIGGVAEGDAEPAR